MAFNYSFIFSLAYFNSFNINSSSPSSFISVSLISSITVFTGPVGIMWSVSALRAIKCLSYEMNSMNVLSFGMPSASVISWHSSFEYCLLDSSLRPEIELNLMMQQGSGEPPKVIVFPENTLASTLFSGLLTSLATNYVTDVAN